MASEVNDGGKTCSTCGFNGPATEFRPQRRICRACDSRRAVDWGRKNRTKKREAVRKYSASMPSSKRRENNKKLRERHPEKYRARIAVQTAIRNGSLVRGACRDCGNSKTHAHHTDYSRPLDVVWLCHPCHMREHYPPMLAARSKAGES